MSTPTSEIRYKLFFTVPHPHLDACKEAIFQAGAGTYPGGKYKKCCFEIPGRGQFLPSGDAKPNIGEVDKLESLEETKVEVLCVGRVVMLAAVKALKEAHPVGSGPFGFPVSGSVDYLYYFTYSRLLV